MAQLFPSRFFSFPSTLFAGLLLLFSATGPAARAQGFAPVTIYPLPAGTRPFGLDMGDVNGDGLLDIVVGEDPGNFPTTNVLLGHPGGNFGSPIGYPAPASSFDLALGDMNRDGRLDLVTSHQVVMVSVRLGQASGFGAPSTYPNNGVITQKLALGDLNNDGQLDIVTANMGTSNVSVLLGRTGGFAPAVQYPTGINSQPEALALGDLTGDGLLDIVTGNIGTATVGVLVGQVGGGFAPVVAYNAFRSRSGTTLLYLMGLALADVNGDGRLDVIASTEDAGSGPALGVLLGEAAGLGPITYYSTGGGGTSSLTAGDANADGWPDLAITNMTDHSVGVLLGYPGGFGAPAFYPTGANSTPRNVMLRDVNNDGRPDLITTNWGSSSVGILLNAPPLLPAAPVPAPSTAPVNGTIAMRGTNLQGAVAVVFTGTANRTVSTGFAVNAAGTEITGIVVPSGAQSGPVRIVTPSGTVASTTAFTLQVPTATQTGRLAAGLAILPNPTRSEAVLSVAATPERRSVVVCDATGRTVQQLELAAQATSLSLQLGQLPAGLYVVRCGTASTRLMIE